MLSLRHCLWAQNQGHHTIYGLGWRGIEKGSSRWSTFKGRDRAFVFQTLELFQNFKGNIGTEHMGTFPSSYKIPPWTELYMYISNTYVRAVASDGKRERRRGVGGGLCQNKMTSVILGEILCVCVILCRVVSCVCVCVYTPKNTSCKVPRILFGLSPWKLNFQ